MAPEDEEKVVVRVLLPGVGNKFSKHLSLTTVGPCFQVCVCDVPTFFIWDVADPVRQRLPRYAPAFPLVLGRAFPLILGFAVLPAFDFLNAESLGVTGPLTIDLYEYVQ